MEGNTKNSYQPAPTGFNMQPEPVANRPQHKDYLFWSICNMVCCCFPIGIAALIFSVKTRDANYKNQATIAADHSRMTFRLNIISSVIGLVTIIAVAILYFVIIMNAYNNKGH